MISDAYTMHIYDRIEYCVSQIVELELFCDFIARRAKQLSFEGCEHHRMCVRPRIEVNLRNNKAVRVPGLARNVL